MCRSAAIPIFVDVGHLSQQGRAVAFERGAVHDRESLRVQVGQPSIGLRHGRPQRCLVKEVLSVDRLLDEVVAGNSWTIAELGQQVTKEQSRSLLLEEQV